MASQSLSLSRLLSKVNPSLVSPKLDYFCQDIPVLQSIFHQRESVAYNEIVLSAKNGCLLCEVLSWATDRLMQEYPSHTFERERVYFDGSNRSSGLLVGLDSPDEPWFFQIQLYIPEDTIPGQIAKSADRTSTGSEATINRAKEWLFTCLQSHHSLCSTMSEENPRLPTRLLEIDQDPERPVKLRESDYRDTRYACLSHCWGGHQPLKTTCENLAGHKAGIQWKDLPKTFQDAIDVVRNLGLCYIWIDSLCIIQDDEDDWNQEAARMADIYRNSVVTISAAAGAGPHAGLFTEGCGEFGTVEVNDPRLQQGRVPPVSARSVLDHQRTEHPLCNRAWVLQERLLSPRVLHFGNTELLWECMEERCCSCGPRQYWPGWLEEKREFHPKALAAWDAHGMSNAWRRVVCNYTSMKLTMERDILPALAGAAKVMAQALHAKGLDTTYLAGLWRFCFIQDCVWSSRASALERRPSTYRAPTYSWASVVCEDEGSVMFWLTSKPRERIPRGDLGPDSDIVFHSRLLEYSYKLHGADGFGQVASSSIVLQGPLMTATIHHDNSRKNIGNSLTILGARSGLKVKLHPDYNFCNAEPQHQVEDGTTLFCLQLASFVYMTNSSNKRFRHLFMMLLRPAEGKEKHVFERIGLVRVLAPQGTQNMDDWFDARDVRENAVAQII